MEKLIARYKEIAHYEKEIKELKAEIKKEAINQGMRKCVFNNVLIKIIHAQGSERFNSGKFKLEHPEEAKGYITYSKPQIKLSLEILDD